MDPDFIEKMLDQRNLTGLFNEAEGDADLAAIKKAMERRGLYTGFAEFGPRTSSAKVGILRSLMSAGGPAGGPANALWPWQ